MSTFLSYEIHLKGTTPLIMNNVQMVDPLNPINRKLRELTRCTKKKDEHHHAISRIQWEGSLYFDDEYGIYIPSRNLQGCIKSGARKDKKGKDTKGVIIPEAIGYSVKGFEKMTPEKLWKIKDSKGNPIHLYREAVKVSTSRVMKSRAIFPKWEVKFTVYLNTLIFELKDLENALEVSSIENGIGDLRPEKACGNYGTFRVEQIKEIKNE